MKKRVLSFLLCAALLIAALPVSVSASTYEEEQRICDQIRSVYRKTSNAFDGDLIGYCGAMAGWELYYLGVTKYPITQNGNDMYDVLSNSEHIHEGYRQDLYPANTYTVEEALNAITACGTKDAYNIMAGYHWTTTEAGSLYGHVTVIHAVLDGMVYFTEGFITPFQADPSQPMICSISEFADYYNGWTGFEGMIHFGRQNELEGGQVFCCSQFVSATEPAELLSRPDPENAEVLRTVPAGERLYAVELYKNAEGVLYYQISEDDGVCYLPAALAEPVWFDYSDLTPENVELPTHVELGGNFTLSGTVRSTYNKIKNLVIQITDAEGQEVLCCEIQKDGYMVDLGSRIVNKQVDISTLPEGCYTYHMYCDMLSYSAQNEAEIGKLERILLDSSDFTVGNAEPMPEAAAVMAVKKTVKNGWQYENGSWYYYENNVPRTGWFCDQGISYFFQADGSAATGWQMINGQSRCFTRTGAMRTGWVENADGRMYLLSNGAPARGMRRIDGTEYCFGENGILMTDTEATDQTDENGAESVE